jgi:hypothetical protein
MGMMMRRRKDARFQSIEKETMIEVAVIRGNTLRAATSCAGKRLADMANKASMYTLNQSDTKRSKSREGGSFANKGETERKTKRAVFRLAASC